MPTKKRTQKQKQKQKQTVIVNINEKPKTRRKRTTKKAPTKRTGESSHIPLDAIRDILFQLSKGTHTPNTIMTRVMATRTQDPQAEIIKDTQDEDKLPNRPPASLTPADAEYGILRGNTSQPSPFVSSTTESKADHTRRLKNNSYNRAPSIYDTEDDILRGNAPQTPLGAYIEQIAQNETPTMNQPPPSIHIETGTSGTDPSGVVDYDAAADIDMNEEFVKDVQEHGDFIDTLNKTRPPARFITSDAGKTNDRPFGDPLGSPLGGIAESRFVSPQAPEAFATQAVTQARALKFDGRIDKDLQEAGFRNAPEVFSAIQKWNNTHGPDDQIVVKSKTITVMKEGLAKNKNVKTLTALKEFDKNAPIELTHIPIPRKVKQSVNLGESSVPRKLQGARFKNILAESSGVTEL